MYANGHWLWWSHAWMLKNTHYSTDDDIIMMMEDGNDGVATWDENHWQAFEFSNINIVDWLVCK